MRRAPATPALLATALLVAGCGGGAARGGGDRAARTTPGDARRAAAAPALCGPVRATGLGHVEGSGPRELSGLVRSRERSGVLWTHNDSGDSARIFALSGRGRLLAQVAVTGAANVDWEDIAAGPGVLYLADTGDNDESRDDVAVYRVPEPRVGAGAAPTATGPARRIALSYPDGAHDAEALLVDPVSRALVLVTKSFAGRSGIYVAPRGSGRLRRAGELRLGFGEAVTAGDVSADGGTVALRTYDRAYVWTRRPGEALAATLRRDRCSPDADLLAEGQGEALALARDGRSFDTVPEGDEPELRRYAASGR